MMVKRCWTSLFSFLFWLVLLFNTIVTSLNFLKGQESEAMFSTNEGMRELANMVGFDRLAIVYLHRGQIYADLEEIKSELSQKIMELCQKGIDSSQQVSFIFCSLLLLRCILCIFSFSFTFLCLCLGT